MILYNQGYYASGGGGTIAPGAITYVGEFTPAIPPDEYPDVTGITNGVWAITGLGVGDYTYTAGDLIGETVEDGNGIIYDGANWTIIADYRDANLEAYIDKVIKRVRNQAVVAGNNDIVFDTPFLTGEVYTFAIGWCRDGSGDNIDYKVISTDVDKAVVYVGFDGFIDCVAIKK